MKTTRHHIAGFSLVELSIVLVILGLLTGGILAGQSLIRAAELRSVASESSRYVTAMGAFRDKYLALPGDISSATNFANMTEQGNANGLITANTVAGSNEIYTFWENLAGAGLIEGTYSTVAYSATSSVAGTTNPRSKLGQANWNIGGLGSIATNGATYAVQATPINYTGFWAANYGNALILGAGTDAYSNAAGAGVMKPEEAWNIDTKIDDGRPSQGTVLSMFQQHADAATAGRCTVTAAPNSVYQLGDTSGTACVLVFKTGY